MRLILLPKVSRSAETEKRRYLAMQLSLALSKSFCQLLCNGLHWGWFRVLEDVRCCVCFVLAFRIAPGDRFKLRSVPLQLPSATLLRSKWV